MHRPAAAALLLLAFTGCAPSGGPAGPDPVRRARAILEEVPLIDGHNDLPWRIMAEAGGSLDSADIARSQPWLHTDLARLESGGVGAVFWAAYVTVDSIAGNRALRHALRQIELIHRLAERYEALELARTAADIERIHGRGRIASLIGVEGGHAIQNSLSALRIFHELGVRYMTLTHWQTIDWADAATDSARHGGLSPFGVEVVREMNRLGMFVDLSHVSDATMSDALEVTAAPVIFSHSSARALFDHPRNVPDSILARVPRNGGVVMVNFCPCFIAPGYPAWSRVRDEHMERLRLLRIAPAEMRRRAQEWLRQNPPPRGNLSLVADHIDHIRRVAGIDHVGIGSDYDGIDFTPEGLDDVAYFADLIAELLRRGYSEADVKKVAGLNVLRAMRQLEQVAARLRRERPASEADLQTVLP